MFYITTSARALKTKGFFFPCSESSFVGGGWIMFMFFLINPPNHLFHAAHNLLLLF